MFTPSAEATTDEASPDQEDSDGESEEEEPLLVLDPRPHDGVLLKSYWLAYFRCAKLCATNLPAFFKMLYNASKALAIILLSLLFITVIFAFTLGSWRNADAGSGMIYVNIFEYSLSEATGCLGLGFWLVTRLLALGIVLSPVICDGWYISTYYHRERSVCIGLAVMFTLVRVLAAVILLKIGKPLLERLFHFLGMLLSYPFRLLRYRIKKAQGVQPPVLIPRYEESDSTEIAANTVLGIVIAYMLLLPDIMAFIVK